MKSPYDVLQIRPGASQEEIRRAYRSAAKLHHPDRNPGDPGAAARFDEATKAYKALASSAVHLDDLLSEVLKNVREAPYVPRNETSAAPPEPRRGHDVDCDMTVTLEEAVYGAVRPLEIVVSKTGATCDACGGRGAEPGTPTPPCLSCNGQGVTISFGGIDVPRKVTCRTCNGKKYVVVSRCKRCKGRGSAPMTRQMSVRIPQGVQSGMSLRLAGYGEPGTPAGDLHIHLQVAPHPKFERSSCDLRTQADVDLCTAIRGGSVQVHGLDGREHRVDVPPGCQSDDILTVVGAGCPAALSGNVGNLEVRVRIAIPRATTDRAKKLAEELADELARQPGSQ